MSRTILTSAYRFGIPRRTTEACWTYQCAVDAAVISAAETEFPKLIQLVVLLPGCPVIAPPVCPWEKYTVILTTVCALRTSKVIGSETASAPLATTILAAPSLNVTLLVLEGSIALCPADPFTGKAIVTSVIVTSVRPNELEKRSRRLDAGRESCTVWRSVVFANTTSV